MRCHHRLPRLLRGRLLNDVSHGIPALGDGTVLEATTPQHCPDEYDERTWAKEGICGEEFHSFVADATIALHGWLRTVLECVRTSTVGPVHFPAATGRALSGHGQVIDPSLTYVLVCRAQSGGEPIDALYIALVTRDPSTRWRGLTGFYIPYCGKCQRGAASAAQRIVNWLPDDAVVQSPDRLPGPIQPAPSWFEGRMLLGVHLPCPVGGGLATDWSQWPHHGQAPALPALACVGSLETGPHNLLFLDDAQRGLPDLYRDLSKWMPHGASPTFVAYRCGNAHELQKLAGGFRSTSPPEGLLRIPIKGRLSRTQLPIDWGVISIEHGPDSVDCRTTSNLRDAARVARREGHLEVTATRITAFHWNLGRGIIRYRDLRDLSSWARGAVAGS